MRVGLVSSAVPLIFGGGRFIVDWLAEKLIERGHEIETIFVPFDDDPRTLLEQMTAFRLLRLDAFERVITFRPPAHVVRHSRKIVWFIHHIRIFYDLWDTPYRDFPDTLPMRGLRDSIMQADTRALREAHRLFTNSRIVGDRLRAFNGLRSEVLYPPVAHPEIFVDGARGDDIVCVCRMEQHKRQHLLIEAMRHVRTGVKLRLCGVASSAEYLDKLRALAAPLGDKVTIENRWITEEEKAAALASSLAAAYVPFDEDSYGYPTVEAAHARRATVTVADAGGVSEFVRDGMNGFVVATEPQAIAAAFDRLFTDRPLAAALGAAAEATVARLGIEWDHVIARLLA
jgi:glycosyltransferase involved in cell wall biosynthesis